MEWTEIPIIPHWIYVISFFFTLQRSSTQISLTEELGHLDTRRIMSSFDRWRNQCREGSDDFPKMPLLTGDGPTLTPGLRVGTPTLSLATAVRLRVATSCKDFFSSQIGGAKVVLVDFGFLFHHSHNNII